MEEVGCARMPTDEGRKGENSLMYRTVDRTGDRTGDKTVDRTMDTSWHKHETENEKG